MTDDDRFKPMAWPDVPRVMFGPAEDWHLNAMVGDRLDPANAGLYLDGYIAAARAIYDRAVLDRINAPIDAVIFPLAFVWRHAIELGLKEIIRLGFFVANNGQRYVPPKEPHHKLEDLWRDAKDYVISTGADPPNPNAAEIVNTEDHIKQLVAVDPYAEGWRFPMNRRGNAPTLAGLPSLVNVRQMHEAMEATAHFLECVRSELVNRADYVMEWLGIEAVRAREYENEMRSQADAEYDAEMRAAYESYDPRDDEH